MFNVKKEVENLKRLNEIIRILFDEGFDILLEKTGLKRKLPIKERLKKSKKEEELPEIRLRRTLERLGPSFIKFGQLLSIRPDVLPPNYIKELEKLQDNVPPNSYSDIKKQIEADLKKPLDKVFSEFEKTPLASASISQVHKAKMKDGKVVAVKVQRPNVKKTMEEDIKIMLYLANLAEKKIEKSKKFEPVNLVKEFQSWTKNELDFKLEARNAKIFGLNFKNDPNVIIPEVYDEYTTGKILTLQYIEGTQLNKVKELKKKNLDLDLVIKRGFNAILTQVFIHGFFHADPHPGNIIVTKDGKISFVDFGIIGIFDDDLKQKAVDLLYGIVFHDTDKILNVLESMGLEENIEGFKHELKVIVEPIEISSLEQVRLSKIIEQVLGTAIKHKLKMPVQFVLLGKTIITLEGIGLQYNPDFKLIDNARPFVENLMIRRLNPIYQLSSFIRNSLKFKKFAETLPDETTRALRKIQRGTIKVDLAETDIKRLSIEIDRSSNRIAYSMLIAAFIIAGALTFGINIGPKLFNVSVFSITSFVFAFIFSITLFISILKEVR